MEDKEDKEELINKEELMTLPMPQGTSHCSCLEHCLLFRKGPRFFLFFFAHRPLQDSASFSLTALRKLNNEFVLNGDFVVSVYRKLIEVSGTKLEYSGSDHVVERINCSKMLNEDIELLVSPKTRTLTLVVCLLVKPEL